MLWRKIMAKAFSEKDRILIQDKLRRAGPFTGIKKSL